MKHFKKKFLAALAGCSSANASPVTITASCDLDNRIQGR